VATITLNAVDISAYVESAAIVVGFRDPLQHVANVGTCSLVVMNKDRYFSPSNTASPFYAALRPNRLVTVVEGEQTLFRGYVESIAPDAGQYSEGQRCVIECGDLLSREQAYMISLPLQVNKTPGALIKLISSAALGAPCATATLTLSGQPDNNSTITIGDITYMFKSALTPAANEVLIGATASATANNLEAAIHAAGEEFGTGLYGTGTEKNALVTAFYEALGGEAGGTTTIEPVAGVTWDFIGDMGYGEKQLAQSFNVSAGVLSEIQVYIDSQTAGTPGTITWALCEDISGYPLLEIQSGTFTPTPGQWNTIAVVDGVSLQDSSPYWLTLRLTTPPAGVAYWSWRFGNSNYTPGVSALKYPPAAWIHTTPYDQFTVITTDAVSDANIDLTAVARGAWGNDIPVRSIFNEATNGDFSGGESDWTFWTDGVEHHEVLDGKLHIYREGGTGATFYQDTGAAMTAGANVALFFKVANVSGSAKEFYAIVRDSTGYTGQLYDTYTIAAGAAETVQAWNKTATHAWADTRVEFFIVTDDNEAALVFDDIRLHINTSDIVASDATLTGGIDEPAGYLDIDNGQGVVEIAADTWRSDSTNALTALSDVAESKFSYLWCAADGTLTFKDRLLPFELANAAADWTLNDDHNIQDTVLNIRDIVNRWSVTYKPRGTTTSGVIARADGVLDVPGRGAISETGSNYKRWNPTDDITQNEGSRTFVIPFVDTGTGKAAGVESLTLPLVAGTDYHVYDESGFDYTNSGRIKFSVAVTGSGIEVHVTNTATGTLYIHDLQIRGVLYIAYNQVTMAIDDASSQSDYGLRAQAYTMPLQVSEGANLAEQIARYLLNRYATPTTRVTTVGFEGPEVVNGVSLYTAQIGQVVNLSETQTLTTGARHWIIGLTYSLAAQSLNSIGWILAPLSAKTYLTLDDAVYGLLDNNYLAL